LNSSNFGDIDSRSSAVSLAKGSYLPPEADFKSSRSPTLCRKDLGNSSGSSDQAHSLDTSEYNVRRRSVSVSTQSLSLTTADSLAIASAVAGSGGGDRSAPTLTPAPTMASFCQETLSFDSVRGINTVTESITPAAAFSEKKLTVVNATAIVFNAEFARNISNVEFAQNVFDVAFARDVFDVDFARNVSDADFARNIPGVDFAQNVQSNFVNVVTTAANV